MQVLGCTVAARLLADWEGHLAPAVQPFFVSHTLSAGLGVWPRWTRSEFSALGLPLSLTDTFTCYAVPPEVPWALLLDEPGFRALSGQVRTALLHEQLAHGRGGVEKSEVWASRLPMEAGHLRAASTDGLFLWWPALWRTLSADSRREILLYLLSEDRLPHRGNDLTSEHWNSVDRLFPNVRRLAGTFARQSGPNCFGTVMAACGVPLAEEVWMHREPFLRWLDAFTGPSEEQDSLGTLLVWRDNHGQLQHAALSLGSCWVLQKDAQSWMAPRQIVTLPDVLSRWNEPGWSVGAYALIRET